MCGSPARREKQNAIGFTELFGYFKHIVMKGIKDITKNVRVLPNLSLWARSPWPSEWEESYSRGSGLIRCNYIDWLFFDWLAQIRTLDTYFSLLVMFTYVFLKSYLWCLQCIHHLCLTWKTLLIVWPLQRSSLRTSQNRKYASKSRQI